MRRTATVVGWELEIARKVRGVESLVTHELRRLAQLGTYPVDELHAIRREFEKLDAERRDILKRCGVECKWVCKPCSPCR